MQHSFLNKIGFSIGAFGLAAGIGCAADSKVTVAANAGIVNATQGDVAVNGTSVAADATSISTLAANSTLTTGASGNAEVLLSPGVFLRVGPDSEIKMISGDLNSAKVELARGTAMVESAAVSSSKAITSTLVMGGAEAQIAKPGMFVFDASAQTASALHGKLIVTRDGKHAEANSGQQLNLGEKLHRAKFEERQLRESSLYAWSETRDRALAASNFATAQMLQHEKHVLGDAKEGWVMDSASHVYTLLPSQGEAFGATGYGFVSNRAVADAPLMKLPVGDGARAVPVNPLAPPAVPNAPQILTANGQPWQGSLTGTAAANASAASGATALTGSASTAASGIANSAGAVSGAASAAGGAVGHLGIGH